MKKPWLAKAVFVLYLCIMVYLLFLQRIKYFYLSEHITYLQMLKSSINLVPMRSVAIFIRNLVSNDSYWARHAVVNLVGNVLMFVPGGFLLPMVYSRARSFKNTCIICLVSLGIIETIQLFILLGSLDIDDIILNMAGIMLGYAFFKAYQKTY